MELTTSTREANGVTIITLSGRLRLGDETRVVRDLVKELVEQDRKLLVLELGQLEYIDSAGLGALVACFSAVRRSGGSLKLLQPSKKVREQLTVTRLLDVFESFEDEAQAVASFAPAEPTGS